MAEEIFYWLVMFILAAGLWLVYGMVAYKFMLWRRRRRAQKEIGKGLQAMERQKETN
jgi:preprotein translocase subunit YajC